jgi:3-deoxy-manno-octulosonate cytidylyltransferase (CMP-KDO synthetase)
VEQHGENPPKDVFIIIPARYSSIRLPGKLLLPIAGKPLILHTLGQAKKAEHVSRVIVATDDERIFNAVVESGNHAVMTSSEHRSGSDRIAEVAAGLLEGSIIVNVQGDEPLISPRTIEKAIEALLNDETADIATTCEPIDDLGDLLNGNVVKVVASDLGYALYFSRSPMPFPREASLRYDGDPNQAIVNEPEIMTIFRKHTGLYVYRREFLMKFTKLPPSKLEQIEMLEQLRALENGARIKVVEVSESSIGVDTPEDFERARTIIEARTITLREATEKDVPAIARVHIESWRKSFASIAPQSYLDNLSIERREKVFAERLSDISYHLFVAENQENGIVGFVDFGKPTFENLNHQRQIYSFYFLPEFQRKGIGSKLFKLCLEKIIEQGCNSLCLDSLEVSPYRQFYDKMGGKIVGRDSHRLGEVDFATVIYGWDDLRAL